MVHCSWSSNSLPSFLCFCLSVLLNAPWPSSSSEHTVVIIHSQSVHWTTTDSFKYCPQPLLHFSVFILIYTVSLPCFAILTSSFFFTTTASTFLCTETHFCIHSVTPSPSNDYLISVISPNLLSYLYYLFFSESSELGGDLLSFTDLCLWPLAIMLGLRQRSHHG